MRSIKTELPREHESIELHTFSDLHIGAATCDYKAIQTRVEYIAQTANAYGILTGDVIDNATRDSVGDVYEGLSPMEQMKQAVKLFAPIKTKILGVTSGNHCDRSYKKEGVDLMYFLCAELGLHEIYDQYGILLFIRFGRELERKRKESNGSGEIRKLCYTIYATHGSAGGRTAGGKANGLSRLGGIVNANIAVISHTHFPMCFKEASFEIDYRNSTILRKETTFVNSGSHLDWGGYSERFSMKPSSKAHPVIWLDGCKHDIRVTL